MVEKRRQAQKKANGKIAVPKEICLKCGAYLQSCYIHTSEAGKRTIKRIGLVCPNVSCDYIIKDFVELEDTEEGEEE
jgi:hypothetical protein